MCKVLYCFISHNDVIYEDILRISNVCESLNISDYFIVCGGHPENKIKNNLLQLQCLDSYEGFSDKIYNLFKFLTHEYGEQYDYYAKIDRLTSLIQKINPDIIKGDYCGSWVKVKDGYDGNRWWHKNKCSKNSEWNNKPYPGKFIPWCRGGSGYFLSNKAAKIIGCNPPDLNYHIYEDLYVAETLLKFNINAKYIFNLQQYLIDPDEGKV